MYIIVFNWQGQQSTKLCLVCRKKRRRMHFPCLVCWKLKEEKSQQYRLGLFLGVIQTNQISMGFLKCSDVVDKASLHTSAYEENVSWVGRCFSVAQHTYMYTLLKECGHMRPRPPPNVVWAIGSQCVLNASWVHSHLYLELTTCVQITRNACQIWTGPKWQQGWVKACYPAVLIDSWCCLPQANNVVTVLIHAPTRGKECFGCCRFFCLAYWWHWFDSNCSARSETDLVALPLDDKLGFMCFTPMTQFVLFTVKVTCNTIYSARHRFFKLFFLIIMVLKCHLNGPLTYRIYNI